MNGAPHPAYGTIVGSGDNANILHYTQNSDVLNNGEIGRASCRERVLDGV